MMGAALVLLYFGMAILAAAVLMQSDRYVVRRSASVDADARKIFALIGDAGIWADEGRATVVESRPNELAVLRIDAEKPRKTESFVTFALKPEGRRTIVECAMSGRNSLFDKARNIIGGREKALGPKIEKALARIAAKAS